MYILFATVLVFLPVVVRTDVESFTEDLVLTPLHSGHVSANFRFRTTKGDLTGRSYQLFPKVIGELVQRYGLEEVHLSLVQGRWRTQQWGYPAYPYPGPTGAQVWAWFNESASIDTRWENLINSLSGLFCASLESIDQAATVSPQWLFVPEGFTRTRTRQNDHERLVRYGVLPSENVCTENLTPWKKLLPCKSVAGLASLLHPIKLVSAHYLSVSLDLRRVCASGTECSWPNYELQQTITVVLPEPKHRRSQYTLEDLFGEDMQVPCPVASWSTVLLDISQMPLDSIRSPNHSKIVTGPGGKKWLAYNNKIDSENGDTGFRSLGIPRGHPVWTSTPPLHMHCYVTGTGQYRAQLRCAVTNTRGKSTKIIYWHVVPWFIRLYFHTFRIDCNNGAIDMDFFDFVPSKIRKRSAAIEISYKHPPQSTCILSVEFEKLLLRWTEYPPDANHGFWIPAPVIGFALSPVETQSLLPIGSKNTGGSQPLIGVLAELGTSANTEKQKIIHKLVGEILLVNMPTPDFSMPYNVICLVCTVVALAFGPIHNLTTKRMALKDPSEVAEKSLKAKLTKLGQYIRQRCTLRRTKPANNETNDSLLIDSDKPPDSNETNLEPSNITKRRKQ